MHVPQEQEHAFIHEAKVPKDLSQAQTRIVPDSSPDYVIVVARMKRSAIRGKRSGDQARA